MTACTALWWVMHNDLPAACDEWSCFQGTVVADLEKEVAQLKAELSSTQAQLQAAREQAKQAVLIPQVDSISFFRHC